MLELDTKGLSRLQIDVLISALETYTMRCKQNAVHCDSNDMPDLKNMWLARVDIAAELRKGV